MKKIQQTIYDALTGNCHAACVASVFELPLESVPNFMADGSDRFHEHLLAYFKPLGWTVVTLSVKCVQQLRIQSVFDGAIGIGGVPSRRLKGKMHSLVVRFTMDGCEVLHDPCSHVGGYEPYRGEEVGDIDLFVRLDPSKIPLAPSREKAKTP